MYGAGFGFPRTTSDVEEIERDARKSRIYQRDVVRPNTPRFATATEAGETGFYPIGFDEDGVVYGREVGQAHTERLAREFWARHV